MLIAIVFPVCTGMNRIRHYSSLCVARVPRMHGDEPTEIALKITEGVCSPYARG